MTRVSPGSQNFSLFCDIYAISSLPRRWTDIADCEKIRKARHVDATDRVRLESIVRFGQPGFFLDVFLGWQFPRLDISDATVY